MKRSEVNTLIKGALELFGEYKFLLPVWANWNLEDWKENKENCTEILDNMLGWDITNFGSDDFLKRGLLLFTVRNGNMNKDKKTYAEKIMVVQEEQETPMHFHWHKMEDIINRGGGNLLIQIYGSEKDEELSIKPLTVKIDGLAKIIQAGETLCLKPGDSICLEQGVYHRFYGEKGSGTVLVGEVSMVNDDSSDNRFREEIGRFPEIEENEAPFRLLAADYQKFLP